MKKFLGAIWLLGIAIIMFSCKKETNPDDENVNRLAGLWRYARGGANEKFLVINRDRTCAILSADANGIHDREDAIALITSRQVMIDFGNADTYPNVFVYNYQVKGDTLSLISPSAVTALVHEKDPVVADSWIVPLSIEKSFDAPVTELTDISFDGRFLWYGNGYNSQYVYKIDPSSGNTDSVATSYFAWAVEAVGDNLWLGDDGSPKLEMMSATDGKPVFSSVDIGAWIYGIAHDGDYLWCYSNNEGRIFRYSLTDNLVISSSRVSGDWAGLAMAGNFLLVAANGKLHKCTADPLAAVASYEIKGYEVFGVAYDGNAVWVSASQVSTGKPMILKLAGLP